MQRRSFLKAGGVIALGAGFTADPLLARIPPHNFDKYDFGSGPPVADRLYQGPFSADDYPSWSVVMALTASHDVVPNYGMGLVTYVCDEVGPEKKDGETLAQSIENLAKLPLGTKLYLRVNWRDVQQRPGRLDFCEHWKLTFDQARRYQKRIGFRVMMSNPDIPDSPLPEFLRDQIPMVKLGDWLGRRGMNRGMTILGSRPLFANCWICWRTLTTGIRMWSTSIHSCMDSGAKAIPGHWNRIRFRMRRLQRPHS